MVQNIILLVVAIIGIIFSFKRKEVVQKVLTIAVSFSIFLAWFDDKLVLTFGLILLLIQTLGCLFYGWFLKGVSLSKRLAIMTSGFLLFLSILANFLHYPFQGVLTLSLIFPLLLFLFTLKKEKLKTYPEFGFLLILNAISLSQIINSIVIRF